MRRTRERRPSPDTGREEDHPERFRTGPLTTGCGLIESLFTPEGIEWVEATQRAKEPHRKGERT